MISRLNPQLRTPMFSRQSLFILKAIGLLQIVTGGAFVDNVRLVAQEASKPATVDQMHSLAEAREFGKLSSRYLTAEASELRATEDDGDVMSRHERRMREYPEVIAPLLQKHCFDCHGNGEEEGNFRVDTLNHDLVHGGDVDWWIELFSVVTKGEMPPPESEPLSDLDRETLVNWLSEELRVASSIRRKSQEISAFRRLTSYEYNYALQDLLGVSWDFVKDLPPEAQSEDGFVNRSDLLHISVEQFEMYHRIARQALDRVVVTGQQPPSLHWLVTADQLSAREWTEQDAQLQKLTQEYKDAPEELEKRQSELEQKFSQPPGGAYYHNQKSGRFARTQWQYYNAKYAFAPENVMPAVPDETESVAILPNGSGNRLIFELGNQLPDHGVMRVTAEVARVDAEETDSYPSLQLMFGWQASNEGRALMVVSQGDVAVTGTVDQPQIVQWDVPLGEIYPRNSVRKTSPMGITPSPSEYIRIVNTSAKKSVVQIRYVSVSSPVFDRWPPNAHGRIFGFGNAEVDERERARGILKDFMTRAWRGKADQADVDRKLKRFEVLRGTCDSFEEAIVEVLAIVLSSPQFLYVSNASNPANGRANSLSGVDLAERLALFLWCSVPDEELLGHALSDDLLEPAILKEQLQRLIKDSRSKRFVHQFVRQWLNLELFEFQNLKGKVQGFDPLLQEAMQRESAEFIYELFSNNESLLNLIHCDFAMVDERLADHYGLSGVRGNHFRRVAIDEGARRGGLLTQAGFLAMNSDYPDSHPLKRSVWLLERILNDPPPPPPPAVPQIDLADPRIAEMTLKERIEDHRNQAACASCHMKIDPWGIAFENYDALGRWRDSIEGKPVDAQSELFNGQAIDGIDGLKRFLLLNRQDQLVHSVVEKLLAFGLGRSLTFADQSEVEEIVRHVRHNDDGFQQAIISMVQSDLFLNW